jgi:hypothetical protein
VKKRRPMVCHIEKREGVCYSKYSKTLIDCFVMIESRTGLTLRWSIHRDVLERAMGEGCR